MFGYGKFRLTVRDSSVIELWACNRDNLGFNLDHGLSLHV